MTHLLKERYQRDRDVWNGCARHYERQIVAGHPDVASYEAFEEDFLDALARYLIAQDKGRVGLLDVGCGSGRLHLRYGRLLHLHEQQSTGDDIASAEGGLPAPAAHDISLAEGLAVIDGLDFSREMIVLAEDKLRTNGLDHFLGNRLRFAEGSAFDLEPLPADPRPLAVTLCNSIGVMQGPEGASQLFASMRRAVEAGSGIALISAYQRQAIRSHALGNYESTMAVSGQPRWLAPDTYTGPGFVQVPRQYKRAYDPDPTVTVDVYDTTGRCVQRNHTLERDAAAVEQTVETGHIRTYSDYESRWYSFDDFEARIAEHWCGLPSYHIRCASFDSLRGAPAQFAILDAGNTLKTFFDRYGVAVG